MDEQSKREIVGKFNISWENPTTEQVRVTKDYHKDNIKLKKEDIGVIIGKPDEHDYLPITWINYPGSKMFCKYPSNYFEFKRHITANKEEEENAN